MVDLRTVAYADHLKPMVLLSLHTGMRYGELANLTWDDLHLDRAILTVHGSSTSNTVHSTHTTDTTIPILCQPFSFFSIMPSPFACG